MSAFTYATRALWEVLQREAKERLSTGQRYCSHCGTDFQDVVELTEAALPTLPDVSVREAVEDILSESTR